MSEIYLMNRDCLSFMKTIPDQVVDSVISDPPYGVNAAIWDQCMPEQEVLTECLRVSKGPVIWFGAPQKLNRFFEYSPQPERILIWAPAFQTTKAKSKGIVYRYHIIACWKLPEMPARRIWDVHNDSVETDRRFQHIAMKPLSLMARLVETFGGQLVFDPYMGSGTTGVACKKLGRDFIGTDNDQEYYEIAVQRIFEGNEPEFPKYFPWENKND